MCYVRDLFLRGIGEIVSAMMLIYILTIREQFYIIIKLDIKNNNIPYSTETRNFSHLHYFAHWTCCALHASDNNARLTPLSVYDNLRHLCKNVRAE